MRYGRSVVRVALLGLVLLLPVGPAMAQPLGPFSWQFSPFCNVLTLHVLPAGASFTLTGFDDLCGAGRAPATGTATPRADGAFALGLVLVTPDGLSVPVAVTLDPATLSGSWADAEGRAGIFLFTPPSPAAGEPRPAPTGLPPTPGAITTSLLAPGAVTADKLAPGAVDTSRIADGTIGAADIDPPRSSAASRAPVPPASPCWPLRPRAPSPAARPPEAERSPQSRLGPA